MGDRASTWERNRVDLSDRLKEIRIMVDQEKYFIINQVRQYGKTTILNALAEYLKSEYEVISLDFQGISYADFHVELLAFRPAGCYDGSERKRPANLFMQLRQDRRIHQRLNNTGRHYSDEGTGSK